jgi:thiol-disulfide isomerase/thioredoxin
MKLDNKYFPLFIACCALITLFVIFYGSVTYQQSQEDTLRSNIDAFDFSDQRLGYITEPDSLRFDDLHGSPVLIHFWASWSDRSRRIQEVLADVSDYHPGLVILAASVRDDEEQVRAAIQASGYEFIWVDGYDLYSNLQVPGVPSQILLNRDGTFFDLQVGDDKDSLRKLIESWLEDE